MKPEFDGLPAIEQRFVFPEFPVTFVELGKKGDWCIIEIECLFALVTQIVQQTNGRSGQVAPVEAWRAVLIFCLVSVFMVVSVFLVPFLVQLYSCEYFSKCFPALVRRYF